MLWKVVEKLIHFPSSASITRKCDSVNKSAMKHVTFMITEACIDEAASKTSEEYVRLFMSFRFYRVKCD